MSAEIVNLNKARKQRARDEKTLRAEQNRRRFGQSKAERTFAEAERSRQDRTLDDAQRELPARLDESHDNLDPGSAS
ncbi:MAG: DUF4169 family protein [Hyphomicrobium sp.]